MSNEKTHGRIARAAVSAALTGAMAIGGVMAPLATAVAATLPDAPGNGVVDTGVNITISADSASEFANQKAFQIFIADVAVKEDNFIPTPSTVEWAGSDVSEPVVAFLDKTREETGATQLYADWLEENGYADKYDAVAAERYIATQIDGSEGASTTVTDKATYKTTFANKFAAHMATVLTPTTATRTLTGAASATSRTITGSEGYYLITSGNVNSAPIYLPVVGNASFTNSATLKKAPAAMTKEVSDKDEDYGPIIDLGRDDKAYFKLTVKPDASSNTYKVEDILPAGLTYSNDVRTTTSGVSVSGSTTPVLDVADQPTGESKLTINLTKSGATELGTMETIEIFYTATVNESATLGDSLNTNRATLVFGDGATTRTTTDARASVASYELDVVETDDDAVPVADAHFVIKNEDGTKCFSKKTGTFVDKFSDTGKAIGTVEDNENYSEFLFSTDEAGKIQIPRIDKGVYLINEVSAAHSKDIKVTIDATYTEFGELETLTANDDGSERKVKAIQNDKAAGIITVRIGGKLPSEIILPITGMTPSQLGTIMGALLVAAGGAAILIRRRKASE